MQKKTIILFCVLLLLSLNSVIANGNTYHLKLLAVQEENLNNYTGSEADLFLEIKDGSGRVFLDTFPLTKMDTQISTRFAKELSCKYFKLDCNKYDFIYTIRASSNIIGGPSAGAAVAALTAIAMLDLDYRQDITITGTINSGGIIGPVGGVKEKLEAASEIGLNKVLIAQGTGNHKNLLKNKTNNSNKTKNLDLIDYGQKNLSLEVLEVVDLNDVLFYLTGKKINNDNFIVNENKEYNKIMRGLKSVLCTRSENIKQLISDEGLVLSSEFINNSKEKEKSEIKATEKEDYYSAASFCFGNNIILREGFYHEKNSSTSRYNKSFSNLERKIELLNSEVAKKEILTISDLQTLIIVKERINDVEQQIEFFNQMSNDELNNSNLAYLLAYSEERLFSALSWMQFFSMEGKRFVLNEDNLRNSCLQKISEAEERYQYANIYLGFSLLKNIREKINLADKSFDKGDLELCLIKAAQAKAEANAILSSIGLDDDNLDLYLESKSKAVEKVISDNSAEQIFPILGYSYYQYSKSLQEDQKYNSLIYLEYALELSDLEIYFPEQNNKIIFNNINFGKWFVLIVFLIVGLLIGSSITWLVLRKKYNQNLKSLKHLKK